MRLGTLVVATACLVATSAMAAGELPSQVLVRQLKKAPTQFTARKLVRSFLEGPGLSLTRYKDLKKLVPLIKQKTGSEGIADHFLRSYVLRRVGTADMVADLASLASKPRTVGALARAHFFKNPEGVKGRILEGESAFFRLVWNAPKNQKTDLLTRYAAAFDKDLAWAKTEYRAERRHLHAEQNKEMRFAVGIVLGLSALGSMGSLLTMIMP